MGQLIYGLISLLISLGLLVYLIPNSIGAVGINQSNPLLAPTIAPYLFAGIAFLASLLILLSSFYQLIIKKQKDKQAVSTRGKERDYLKLMMAAACVAGFVFLLPKVGVEIAVSLLFIGLLATVREKRPLVYVVLLVVAVFISEFFIDVVEVPLPSSIDRFYH